MNDRIEEGRFEERVGFVDKYHSDSDSWRIILDHGRNSEVLTTEEMENSNYFLGGDMYDVYREISTKKCVDCSNRSLFFDEEKEEFYCPPCEEKI